ncbi:hypothetical protein TNCV_739531 [Trichonephila clavipes]|nr:hypothetical protein TNCV_739531 [Trichonephila clavipes]
MGKLPGQDAFDRRQIVGAPRMGSSISEIVRQPGFSWLTVSKVYAKNRWMVDKKTSDRANCKEQLTLTMCGRDSSGVLYVTSEAKH